LIHAKYQTFIQCISDELRGVQSASEQYRPICGRVSVKLVPSVAGRGVSRGQPGGSSRSVNIGFLDRSHYLYF
jgi:hypothetical protein